MCCIQTQISSPHPFWESPEKYSKRQTETEAKSNQTKPKKKKEEQKNQLNIHKETGKDITYSGCPGVKSASKTKHKIKKKRGSVCVANFHNLVW